MESMRGLRLYIMILGQKQLLPFIIKIKKGLSIYA